MPQLHYSIQIDQAPLTVHNVLVDKEAYATWTYSFSSASCFDGDWSEGSQMLFTFVGANQTQWGMVARVDKNQPGELIQSAQIVKRNKDLEQIIHMLRVYTKKQLGFMSES